MPDSRKASAIGELETLLIKRGAGELLEED